MERKGLDLLTVCYIMDRKYKNYVYILRCADGTYYTGWTTDPAHRLEVHNSGKGAKYTRPRLPVEMVYLEEFDSKGEALSREWQIKHLTRQEKEELIDSYKGGYHG